MTSPGADVASTLIAVFSFNRGRHLRRCIESIARHAPAAPVVVFDDGSTDTATREVLESLRGVEVARAAERGRSSFGGLYENINAALDRCERDGFEHAFLLQDDQQLVRALDDHWWASIGATFAAAEDISQVVPLFLADVLGEAHFRSILRPHPSGLFYEHRGDPVSDYDQRAWGACDTGVVAVRRLRDRGVRFGPTELATAVQARAVGLRYVRSRDPVAMFTPWPAVSRSRPAGRSSISHRVVAALTRLNEVGVGAGRASLLDMDENEVAALLDRPIDELPFAERWLRTDRRVRTPWHYSRAFDRADLRPVALVTARWLLDGPPDYRRLAAARRGEARAAAR